MYLMREKLALAALFMHRRQSLNVCGGSQTHPIMIFTYDSGLCKQWSHLLFWNILIE